MRNRALFSPSITTILTALGGMSLIGCGGQPATPADPINANEALAAIVACGLDDGTLEPDAHLNACDPQDAKKTTICHIPPGNPANAHTICVGNSAVSHHVKNHGDYVGPCQVETPCPPVPPCSTSHGKGDDGAGGACATGTGGTTGSGGATGTGGMTGAGGASPPPMCPEGQPSCTSTSDCTPDVTYCNGGCCVPVTPV